MPVILPRDRYGRWLAPQTPGEELVVIPVPFPAELMRLDPISERVNSPWNGDATWVDPV